MTGDPKFLEEAEAEAGQLMESYDFHDVSESIPEDDEEYSSSDGTYYSEEFERNHVGDGKDDGSGSSFSSAENDGDGNGNDEEGNSHYDPSSSDGYDDDSYRESENDEESYFRDDSYRSEEGSDALTGRNDESHDDSFSDRYDGDSYSEENSENSGAFKLSKTQTKLRHNSEPGNGGSGSNHRPSVQRREVSDCETSVDSGKNEYAPLSHTSYSEKSASTTLKDEASKESGETSFQFSAEWGSFDQLDLKQPSIVRGGFDTSGGDAPLRSKASDSKKRKNSQTHHDSFPADNGFDDDPFGGDPFAEKAKTKTEPQTIIAQSHSFQSPNCNEDSQVSGTDNTDACGIYPFATFSSSYRAFSMLDDVESKCDNEEYEDDDGEGDFVVQETNSQTSALFQHAGESRSSGDEEGEPSFSATNHDVQYLGDCITEDTDFVKGNQNTNDKLDASRPSDSQNKNFGDFHDGKTATDSDENDRRLNSSYESSSSSSSSNEDSHSVGEPIFHHESNSSRSFASKSHEEISPQPPPLDTSEDSRPSDFDKEGKNQFQLALDASEDSGSSYLENEEKSRPLEHQYEEYFYSRNEEKDESSQSSYNSSGDGRSFKSDNEESRSNHMKENSSGSSSSDGSFTGSAAQRSDGVTSNNSDIEAGKPGDIKDESLQKEEESSSSYFEKVNFGANSNDDNFSDSDPHGGDDFQSINADKKAISSGNTEDVSWQASFDASNRSRSKSPQGESSSSENFESKPLINEANEAFHASFGSNFKPSSNATTSNYNFEHPKSGSPKDKVNKSSLHILVSDDVDEPSEPLPAADRPKKSNDDNFLNGHNDPEPRSIGDGSDESWKPSFDGSQSPYSESPRDVADEPVNADFRRLRSSSGSSRSIRGETNKAFQASFGDSEPYQDQDEDSWNSKADGDDQSETNSLLEEDDEPPIFSSASTGHTGFRSFEDDADSSWNSKHSKGNESCNSSFHNSELSKSLRVEVQESFNPLFENSEHSRTKSIEEEVGESLYPKFDNDENSLEEEEVEASHHDSSFFDESQYTTSVSPKEGTNESCSASASGFDSSEFSRSLRIEAKESFNPDFENFDNSARQSPSSDLDTPEASRKDEQDGSVNAAFDTSEVSRFESLKEEANESHDKSFKGSDGAGLASIMNEAGKSKSSDDDGNRSQYSSSFDSHKDFRSRSLNKKTVDESWNSAFDMSRSFDISRSFDDSRADPFEDQSNGSSNSSEVSGSKAIKEEPNQLVHASIKSGTSGDQGKHPPLHPVPDQSNSDTESTKSGVNSTPSNKRNNNVGRRMEELVPKITEKDESNKASVIDSRKDASLKSISIMQSPDDNQNEDSFTGTAKQKQELEKDRNSMGNEVGQDSEVSMMIGDVFGQPNELFQDFNKRDSSSKSSVLTGYISQRKEQKSLIISEEKNETDSKGTHPEELQNKVKNEEIKQDGNAKKSKVLSEKERRKKKKRRKQRRRRKREAKSPALLDFAANVNEAILNLEGRSESNDENIDSPAYSLIHGFDALLGIFLQLSDELELIATFSELNKKDVVSGMHVSALTAILGFAETFDQLFADLKPIIFDSFEEEPDEYMDDLFDRLDALVDLLCETTHRVGEKQEWNCRAETTYVTLLELVERDSLDLRCYYDDIETPDPGISANVHEAWSATGHVEELKALQGNDDPQIFRQICYEVMVSTDQWCPDTDTLMGICDIDLDMLKEDLPQEHINEDELAPIPQAAEHILDKVNGETLRRSEEFASILRRILPPHAVTDASLRSHFTSIRNSIDSPLALSATNVVSISSVPESMNDPDALGVAGVGKTTLAAMVAEHRDVRRYFIDGVVWVYLGDEELNYNRYTQCLRELVAQLDFYDGIPLFAELLHTPGENPSKRKRREEGFMIYARDTIAGLLEDRSILIILDDVCYEPDMDWFDFAPMPDESTNSQGDNCALVITTRRRSLLPAADTVEIDMLNEADAITLLIQESGQLSHTLMAESKEARSVVRECANHPLAVKSIGRWLNLKHATAGVVSSVEEIHSEVIKSMDKILKSGDSTGTDMMYEILSTSLSPAINGGPTSIIKFCFAAFIMVFCDRNHISEFELTEPTPIIPMDIAELLFQTLLEMYEVSLLKKGSLFYAQKKEAAVLIPEALSALGVLKVITYSDAEEEETADDEQKFLQVMHSIYHEYGVYLVHDDISLKDFTKDAERQWNRALVDAYVSRVREWDWDLEDSAHSYALEMIISHMIRGTMYNAASNLLTEKSFIRGRIKSLGRENCTKRHIKDCELLCKKLNERVPRDSKLRARSVMKNAYRALGRELTINANKIVQDERVKNVEVARAHYEIGFSLAENRCWDAAIAHWETSQELLMSALGSVEVVAGILYNIGVVYAEMNEYEQSLNGLKQCLKIRATIHGEEHVLYAQTIQKMGDVFLNMSDYHEAMESYNWALDVMYREPDHHYIEIGEILDNKGAIHYSKGEVDEALQCHQEALRSKQEDLGEDHPELAETYHHIGNCLSDQGNIDDAIVHFEEAVRLKELDPEGGPERDADVLTIEGILNNLEGNQEQGLECYERSLQILVTKVPYRKEKIAALLHLIGCVYLMSGEQTKAMKLFKESLQARRKVLGYIHLDVASTLFNMAFLHQTRNRFDKALRCLEEALKIRQLRLPESEKVAVTHEKIGSLARGMGKAKKAQIAFEEALKIRKSIHGQQHEAVATVLQELGDLMDDLGEYESAMSFYIDALEIRRNRLGLDDIAVAETLYSMGYTLHNSEEPDRALACFVEALSIRRFQIGEDSMEVGDTLNMMGFLKSKRNELDDALTLLWDALRIRKLQDDHIKVSETLKNIGNVHKEKGEPELALECYEECLRIRKFELGHNHEKVADVLIAMGNMYGENPLQMEEAKESYQEALGIRKGVFGDSDEKVAVVLKYMGTIEFRSNNHYRARDLLMEFVKIRRDNGTHNDGDYVNVLLTIGNIHRADGKEAEARLCWNEAYQVFQKFGLAETNPQIAEAMGHLVEEDKIDEYQGVDSKANKKSLFGIVTENLFKKDKSDDESLYQNSRKSMRRIGKGFKL